MADYNAVTHACYRTWMLGGLGACLLILGGLYLQLRERRFTEQRHTRQELEVRVRERTQELGEAHAFRKAMEDFLLVVHHWYKVVQSCCANSMTLMPASTKSWCQPLLAICSMACAAMSILFVTV